MLGGLREIAADQLVTRLMACFGAGAFNSGGLLVAMSLTYALAPEQLGMGFGAGTSGLAYSWMALAGFLFQVILYPRVLSALGIYHMCWASNLQMLLSCLSMPLVAAEEASGVL
jgi:hypothetical protein